MAKEIISKKIAKQKITFGKTSKNIMALSSIEDIIKDAKKGKMFILVDDENRENEGDLIVAAEKIDDKKINFMAKYGRGLICLALDEKRVNQLELPLMSSNNESRHKTAFTVSIEARSGISTGISASDRATTIIAAIDPSKGKEGIVSPGHIFPLQARNGGVLVRAGHTEASVDIARLAGLNPSAVICEIMNDDGTMARLPDLQEFAKKHELKIASIADLIQYRRNNEKLIELVNERKFVDKNCGEFVAKIYRSKIDDIEHIALVKGEISNEPALVRMHHFNILNDCFLEAENFRAGLLQIALKKIAQNGSGIAVVIRHPDKQIIDETFDFVAPNATKKDKNSKQFLRNYGIGAQILSDLGAKNLVLLTNNKKSVIGLSAYGIKISGYKKLF